MDFNCDFTIPKININVGKLIYGFNEYITVIKTETRQQQHNVIR